MRSTKHSTSIRATGFTCALLGLKSLDPFVSMSTGKTYEISGELTEWEDIMINKGIKTRDQIFIEKGLNPEDVSAASTVNWFCHSNHSPADFSRSVPTV